jgi:hypothetical protein
MNSSDSTERAIRGFQPRARRRNRIAGGVLLAAVAVGGNLLLYSRLDDARPVVQATRDIPAGEQLSSDMLRTVEVDADSTVNLIDGEQLDALVGSYAKVRLVSGGLLTAESLQSEPLVTPGRSVVAVQVPDGRLPVGLRERSAVVLVLPADPAPVSVAGLVVGLPTATGSTLGGQSLSVEVAADAAATVAAADDVRVVLAEPPSDPAADAREAEGEP